MLLFTRLISPLGYQKKWRKLRSAFPSQFPSPSLLHLWALDRECLHIFLYLFQVLFLVLCFVFFKFLIFLVFLRNLKHFFILPPSSLDNSCSHSPWAGHSTSTHTPPLSCSECPSWWCFAHHHSTTWTWVSAWWAHSTTWGWRRGCTPACGSGWWRLNERRAMTPTCLLCGSGTHPRSSWHDSQRERWSV